MSAILTSRALDQRRNPSARRHNIRRHADGALDERVAGFYETLRSRFPDFPPYPDESPWMSMPLDAGIDHVIMNLSFSAHSDPAIKAIQELAARFHLILWDPQSQDAYLPGR
jgi:hypothetical protein